MQPIIFGKYGDFNLCFGGRTRTPRQSRYRFPDSHGEIQRMSAGTGIKHSEFNHSATNPLHLLQIWIIPDPKNLEPSYEQKAIEFSPHTLQLIPHSAPSTVT